MFFERLLIMGRRTICSTSVLCKFKYSSEEIEKILSVVNNSNVEDLTARYASSCEIFNCKNGFYFSI